MWVICSWFKQNAGKNERFTWKTLTVFYPFDAQEQIAHVAHCSFLKLLSEYLRLLFTEEQPERFAHVAHNKKTTVRNLLMLLFKQERKCDSLKKTSELLLSLFSSQKTCSEFPTLKLTVSCPFNLTSVNQLLPATVPLICKLTVTCQLSL